MGGVDFNLHIINQSRYLANLLHIKRRQDYRFWLRPMALFKHSSSAHSKYNMNFVFIFPECTISRSHPSRFSLFRGKPSISTLVAPALQCRECFTQVHEYLICFIRSSHKTPKFKNWLNKKSAQVPNDCFLQEPDGYLDRYNFAFLDVVSN